MGSLTLYDLLGVTGDVASRVSAGVEMVLGRRGAVGGLLTDHALQQLLENWVRKKRCKHEQKEHWLHRETHSRLVQPPPCPCDCGSHGPLCTIATIGPSTHVHVGSHYCIIDIHGHYKGERPLFNPGINYGRIRMFAKYEEVLSEHAVSGCIQRVKEGRLIRRSIEIRKSPEKGKKLYTQGTGYQFN